MILVNELSTDGWLPTMILTRVYCENWTSGIGLDFVIWSHEEGELPDSVRWEKMYISNAYDDDIEKALISTEFCIECCCQILLVTIDLIVYEVKKCSYALSCHSMW